MNRLVEITKDDIKNGLPGHCHACPGVIAIQKAFPEISGISLCSKDISYCLKDGTYMPIVNTPKCLRFFMYGFDNHSAEAEPLAFFLDLPITRPET